MSWGPSIGFVLITSLGTAAALISSRLGLPRTHAFSKAAASLGFVGTALAIGAMDVGWSRLVLVALLLSAAGDVALAVRGKNGFLIGLLCFAAAHSVFTAAFALYGTGDTILMVTAAVGVLVAGAAWLGFSRRLPGPMRVPVGIYIAIVSAMLATGIAAGLTHRAVLLVCGVVLVAGSDIAVGRERFGAPGFANKLVGLPTYYLGQTLIALSITGP